MDPMGPEPEWDDEPDPRLKYAVIGAGAAVLLVALVLVVLALTGGDDGDRVAVDATTSSSATFSTLPTSTSSTVPTTPATLAPTTTEGPALARLTLLSGRLEFGTSATTIDVGFRNDGGQELRYTVTTSNPRLAVSGRTGSLRPGESGNVRITLDRNGSPEGPVGGDVTIDAGTAGSSVLPVSGTVARPPRLSNVTIAGSSFHTTCDPLDQTVEVTATVGDDTGVARVELRWRSAANGDGTKQMTVTGDQAAAELGPFANSDTINWQVVVIDTAGNQTASEPADIDALDCGGL